MLKVGVLALLLGLSGVVVVTALRNAVSHKVVLSADGVIRQLTYDCDRFRAQATNGDDIRVVMSESLNVVKDASQAQDLVTVSSLMAAEKAHDIRGMERVIVEYRCAH